MLEKLTYIMKQLKLEKGTKKKVIKNQATLSFFLRKMIKPMKDPHLPLR